jgi:hypothetical protein
MGTEERPPQPGGRAPGVDEQVEGQVADGRRNAEATPPIADDAVKGQTRTHAPPDDVGVPPDEEMNRPQE